MSSSFCMRAASSPCRAMVFSGRMVTSATSGVKSHFNDLVLVASGSEDQLSDMLELEGHGTFRAHVATVLAEGVTHIRHSAHAIVGHGVHDDGRAADAIAFVADFLVGHAFEVARGLVDVALDVVGRHVGRLGLFHRQAQARVGAEIAPSRADRKSTRLNSSHLVISYAVFCLKKKKAISTPPHERARSIDAAHP